MCSAETGSLTTPPAPQISCLRGLLSAITETSAQRSRGACWELRTRTCGDHKPRPSDTNTQRQSDQRAHHHPSVHQCADEPPSSSRSSSCIRTNLSCDKQVSSSDDVTSQSPRVETSASGCTDVEKQSRCFRRCSRHICTSAAARGCTWGPGGAGPGRKHY